MTSSLFYVQLFGFNIPSIKSPMRDSSVPLEVCKKVTNKVSNILVPSSVDQKSGNWLPIHLGPLAVPFSNSKQRTEVSCSTTRTSICVSKIRTKGTNCKVPQYLSVAF